MSWAAHDVEGWNQVCITGIMHKLSKSRGLTQSDPSLDREVLEELQDDFRSYNVFLALMDWASEEISNAEGDYHMKGCGL